VFVGTGFPPSVVGAGVTLGVVLGVIVACGAGILTGGFCGGRLVA